MSASNRLTAGPLASAIVGAAAVAGHASGSVVADSVADFSHVQGQGGWYYGYYDGDSGQAFMPPDFEEMTAFVVNWWMVHPDSYFTSVSVNGAHPNSVNTTGGRIPVEQWAVRRWVSEVGGRVYVSGVIGDIAASPNTGDGVEINIFVENILFYTRLLDNGETDVRFHFPVVLSAGGTLDFAVGARSSDRYDTTEFRILICDETANLDGDNVTDVFDLLLYLDTWFAADADRTGDGQTDVFDLLEYLDVWFSGC